TYPIGTQIWKIVRSFPLFPSIHGIVKRGGTIVVIIPHKGYRKSRIGKIRHGLVQFYGFLCLIFGDTVIVGKPALSCLVTILDRPGYTPIQAPGVFVSGCISVVGMKTLGVAVRGFDKTDQNLVPPDPDSIVGRPPGESTFLVVNFLVLDV